MANRPRTSSSKPSPKEVGKGLSAKKVDGYLRFVVFLAVIGLAYIWNAHYAERQVQERAQLKKEVKKLKDDYYMKKAELEAGIRYAEMVEMTDTLGLEGLRKPPFKLVAEGIQNKEK